MRPIVNMPEEDRATDIGNIHKKIDKDRACGSGDILADRQTNRHTHRHTDRQTHSQTYSSQYFATAPEGEVTSCQWRQLGRSGGQMTRKNEKVKT